MTDAHGDWDRLLSVYERARALDGDARRSFLDETCAGEAELRAEVERLLGVDVPEDFLATPSPATGIHRAFGGDFEGATLGEFTIQREIGRGGMGAVYLARQAALDRDVALKVLPPLLRADRVATERFRREAIAASRIHHPSIARVITAGEDRGLLYFAMEYVAGGSLVDAAEGLFGPVDAADSDRHIAVARFMALVAEGIAAAHAQDVVHRDIKPGNVLVGADGKPRIVDFGLARLTDLERLTESGAPAGTLAYMSPEQARAKASEIDHRTDIYSAGAMLYDLLTGRPPIRVTNAAETLQRIERDDPRRPSAVVPGIPRALDAVCLMALRKSRTARYQTAQEFADDLRRFAEGIPVRARSEPLRRRLLRSVGRRPGVLAAVSFAGLIATGAGFASTVLANHRASTGRVEFDLGAGEPVVVEVQRFVDGEPAPVPTERALEVSSRRAVRLDPGRYRFATRVAGAWRHFDRALEAGSSISIAIAAVEPASTAGMVRIEAATIRYAASYGLIGDGPAPEAGAIFAEASHPAFLIDRSPVPAGAFHDWLESREPGSGASWSASIRAAKPSGWRELPATAIPLCDAQAYAESLGKRLPSRLEWCAAAQGGDPDWFADRLSAGGSEQFDLGLPAMIGGPDEPRAARQAQAFARYVLPGGTEPQGPLGLTNLVGGVDEWTCELADVDPALGGMADQGLIGTIGTNWTTSTDGFDRTRLTQLGFSAPIQRDLSVGFRCVLPLTP